MDLFTKQQEEFRRRHIGPDAAETRDMLDTIGLDSVASLMNLTIPEGIRLSQLPGTSAEQHGLSEAAYLAAIGRIASMNKVHKSFIGLGYYGTITPSVILRNVFENPGWYTQYTPYQAEISQGRLETLLGFQTMVSDLTGLPIANASLLDEATAAAEAMHLVFALKNKGAAEPQAPRFFVQDKVFPQTKDVLETRAAPLGIELVYGSHGDFSPAADYCGVLVQYPDADGSVEDYREFIARAHASEVPVIMATDLLALALLTPPGELGADIAVGSAQRMGVPMGFGGPHAAFFATREEYKRLIPGRIIGVSEDAQGNRALRMALQTREQHIRREKATSNICTAQALLANMAALYAVYHGPEGIREIATRVSTLTRALARSLEEKGFTQHNRYYFDTLSFTTANQAHIRAYAEKEGMNFRYEGTDKIGISLDETTTREDIDLIVAVFTQSHEQHAGDHFLSDTETLDNIPEALTRTSPYLTHPVFNTHHSETRMMRYLRQLENKDLALDTSMIPLGSCTMKLNAATELIPVSWPAFAHIHPFAPGDQTIGYQRVIEELSSLLCTVTGLNACSLQPNSGAQGEFTGLMVIRAYHLDHGDAARDVVLIPISAHGTNPASAVMAGMKVVVIKCDEKGNIDVEDLKARVAEHRERLAGLMVTYPSTYGVYEPGIRDICRIVHEAGGLVYLDGANLNAQIGYTNPGVIGADVCHLNLHKTFAIPHGGGGPGVGPICVNEKLAPYLPGSTLVPGVGGEKAISQVSAAPYGSASILLISYAYIRMLGIAGLKKATEYAVLNANYMKARLEKHYPVLYSGRNNTCAHEFIVDLRPFKKAGIEAEDVAKRLMDYGFHAPTLSFAVAGALMIEPTESEDKAELDRFCDAMISIREEIAQLERGEVDPADNVLKNAPHTQQVVTADTWDHPYSRTQAAFPLPFVKENKFWPSVARINNTLGDRNLICTCEPVEAYA
jgi:glycine dehydrogenase